MNCARPTLTSALLGIMCSCAEQDRTSTERSTNTPWRLAIPARVEIGGGDEFEVEQFYQIRSVVRMQDGGIVVADGGSNELRFFDSRGEHVRSVGGEGEGPGEFRSLRWVDRTIADTLIAWDGGLRRATVFNAEGVPIRTFLIPTDAEFPLSVPEQVFWDGSVLSMVGPPEEEVDSTGRGYWSVVGLTRTSAAGSDFGRVARVGAQRCSEPGCARRFHAFRALWAAGEDHVFYYRPDQAVVQLLGRQDGSQPRLSIQLPPSESDTLPNAKRLLSDHYGLMWIEDVTGQWHAIAFDGTVQGVLEVPAGVIVHEITPDYVLGTAVNDLGVERVVLFDVERK